MDKLDMILEKLDGMDGEIKGLRTDMNEVKGEIADLKDKVGNIEFVIENEIRTNIARIAEGHLDLSRNLQEAMKPNNEFEMLTIKVNVLESDVEAIKQKIS